MSCLRQLDSERGEGRGLRIAELSDTCARVSKQQHAVDRYIVNDGGSIDGCGDAMRPPPYPLFPVSLVTTTTPEPRTLLCFAIGCTALAVVRRRPKRA